jgi:hypothetical protein
VFVFHCFTNFFIHHSSLLTLLSQSKLKKLSKLTTHNS